MRKSWLMCVLLGTLAWGQAAPSAPPPPQTPPAAPPADTSAAVPADAAVITVIGVCSTPPKTASATGTAAKTGTAAAKTPAAKTPAADCKTIITKAQFEDLAKALIPNVTPQAKKQLAGVLPRFIGMSSEAKKEGLEKTKQFDETV